MLSLSYHSYLSCPEKDEHDDSDSTSFTLGNSEKGSISIKKSGTVKKEQITDFADLDDLQKLNSLDNLGLAADTLSTSKTSNARKSILKNKISDFKEDYDGVVALDLKRKPNSRLSLKFEDMEAKQTYSNDTTSFTPCGLQRKKTEEMKIDSQIFSKYKKILCYSGTKIELTASPDFESKKNRLLNPSKLSFNAAIDEDEEFSLCPNKYQSCNLEAFDPKFGVRKGSSILSKLRLGVTRKHTTPLFSVTKGNIDEEDDDALDCK